MRYLHLKDRRLPEEPLAIFNLGSINIDYVYRVPHHVSPGETLASEGLLRGLGGKGANQSVAAARAGGKVVHIGAVGEDADWAVAVLREAGVRTTHITRVAEPTGHAIITVDPAGENAILLFRGANGAIPRQTLANVLADAGDGDWFLLQNETALGLEAAELARERGLRIAYSAAPFEIDAVQRILPLTDLLVVNAIEAEQARKQVPNFDAHCERMALVITRGAEGATWMRGPEASLDGTPDQLDIPAVPAEAVDTTGAGDTFLGYLLAGLDRGGGVERSMRLAAAAASIQVTRPGAINAIPTMDEVERSGA